MNVSYWLFVVQIVFVGFYKGLDLLLISGQPKTKSLHKRIFLVGHDLVYNIYKQVQTYMVYVRFLEADLVYPSSSTMKQNILSRD